jgi:tRNA-dependent cyclodipeptide synthase
MVFIPWQPVAKFVALALVACLVTLGGVAGTLDRRRRQQRRRSQEAAPAPAVLLGISPGNAFFRVENMAELLAEAQRTAPHVFVLCPSVPAQHTYAAVGARVGAPLRLHRRFERALRAAPTFDGDRVHLIDWARDVAPRADFADSLAHLEQLLAASPAFAAAATEMASRATQQLAAAHQRAPPADLTRAVRYILEELAFFDVFPAFLRERLPAGLEFNPSSDLPLLYCREWPVLTRFCAGEFDGRTRRRIEVRLLQGACPPAAAGRESANTAAAAAAITATIACPSGAVQQVVFAAPGPGPKREDASQTQALLSAVCGAVGRPAGTFWLRAADTGAAVAITPTALAATRHVELVPRCLGAAALLDVAQGFWAARVLQVACELGLFDAVACRLEGGGGWCSFEQLAAALGWPLEIGARGQADFLCALEEMGLVDLRHLPTLRVRLTPLSSKYLLSSSLYNVGAYISMCSSRLYGIWARLPAGLSSGRCQNESADQPASQSQTAIFEQLCANPAVAQFICEAMQGAAVPVAEALAACCSDALLPGPLRGTRCIVDVGGGNGAFTAILLQRLHASITAVVLDLEHARGPALALVARAGLADRQQFVARNFEEGDSLFEGLPLQLPTLAVLGHVLHGLGAEARLALLRRVHASLAPGSRVMVYEMFTTTCEPVVASRAGLLSSLNMLLDSAAGAEMSVDACLRLLGDCGFADLTTMPLPLAPSYTCVIGTKVNCASQQPGLA